MDNFFTDFNSFNKKLSEWKNKKYRIVFTNGCFDILHRGHVEYLNKARKKGDILIVGLNSDDSVKRLKGPQRPYVNESDRAFILINLKSVDAVVLFKEDTPESIIKKIIPDVLVKGGDYSKDNIVGKEIVEKNGGKVLTIELIKGKSSSSLIQKIKETD